MERLKILQVINVRWYNAEADYCLKLAKSLASMGMDITVMGQIMGQNNSPVIKMAGKEGLKTITHIDINSQNPVSVIANFFALKSFLKKNRFDIVNFHRSEGFAIGALACRAADTKVVRTRGDTRPVRKGFFNKALYNTLTDLIITSGDVIKKSIIERLGCREEKIHTIYTAVDTDFFTPKKRANKLHEELGIPSDTKIAAILGRLGKVKGHDFFLKAAKIVKESDEKVKFLIVAKDVEENGHNLDELIKELKLEDDVYFIMDDRSDIADIAASVDIGVITSTASEANCRVALEWMSSGVPVVSFSTGVIPEVVTDGGDGFIVPTGDYNALAKKISDLLKDDAKWELFSDNARKKASQKFNLTRFGEETLKVYSQILRS